MGIYSRFFLLLSALSISTSLFAQTESPSHQEPQSIEIRGLDSPRETMKTFLNAMRALHEGETNSLERAISTLNLVSVNALVRTEKSHESAWILFDILVRTGPVSLNRIPRHVSKDIYLYKKFKSGSISISLQPDGRWLFSEKTIRSLPSILEDLPKSDLENEDDRPSNRLPWHIRVRENLSDDLKGKWFFLEHWQWLGIFFYLIAGFFANKILNRLLRSGVRLWRKYSRLAELWLLPDDWLKPLGLLAMSGIWWLGINSLGLSTESLILLLVAVKLFSGWSGIWAGYRLIDFASAYLQHHARQTKNKLDDVLVPLARKTLKVLVTVFILLVVASNMNLNLSGLVAGLGLGGLAFALAAKDMVQNLFGSITVLMDQSFHVGDWVKIGDVEGTVEEVGLRSTRIRTFYNSEIILPNSTLITASIDNLGKRQYRRLSCKISLIYGTTPEKIELFCEAIRELVRLHPYMRKDYFQVYLNELSASSLDVLVYVFWETPDWSIELRERHRFLMDILRIAEHLQIDFAFPTQTIHWQAEQQSALKHNEDLKVVDNELIIEKARAAAQSVVSRTL